MKRLFTLTFFAFAALCAMAQTLNVGSFNIRMHSKVDYKNGDGWTERREVMCDLVAFTAFDIFGAQEVCHDQLEYMLERLPEYDYIGVARDDGKKKGEYSPVFYRRDRFELLDSGTFWLSETPNEVSKGWDGACRRVCSWAYLQRKSDKARFYFLSTHLDHKGKEAQKEGMKLIVKKFKEYNPDGFVQFLTGDLNVKSDNEALDVLKDYMVNTRSAAPKDKTDNDRTYNGFSTSGGSVIDHVYCTKGMEVVEYHTIDENYGSAEYVSDHYPIYAIIKM